MNLIIFRHAERAESGLSPRGQQQAEALVLTHSALGTPHQLVCSPQLRSQATFAPLSTATSISITITVALDERQRGESGKDFTTRVQQFLNSVPSEIGNIYICTHLDWIEEALIYLDCDQDLLAPRFQHWKTGQYLKLRFDSGLWIYEDFGRISC